MDPRLTATIVLRSGSPVLNLTQYDGSHTVVVEISYGWDSNYAISIYCRFSFTLVPFLQRIRLILSALRAERVILCIYSNAKSASWGAAITDERGRDLEDLLIEVDLYVTNHPILQQPSSLTRGQVIWTLTTHP